MPVRRTGYLLLATLVVLAGCRAPAPFADAMATTGSPHAAAPVSASASAALAALPIRRLDSRTGYIRLAFGPAWTDDNSDPMGHNGCDTRSDILRRDLEAVRIKPGSRGCIPLSGTLHDPYTGRIIVFNRGASSSAAVQIDHMTALLDDWLTGAQLLTAAQRTDLANDPLNLLAVDGPTNEAKGDGDAAAWLPPNPTYRCAYVAHQIAVKTKYHLWVIPAERLAISRVLATCPDQLLPIESTRDTVGVAP